MKSFIALFLSLSLFACRSTGDQNEPAPAGTDTSSAVAAPKSAHRVIHTPDGGRMEGMEVDGKREGPWASYYPNGGIRSRSTFVHGSEEGATEVFHENGMTYYTGEYLHGQPFGHWIFFDPQGKELQRVEYDSTGEVVPVVR